MAEAARPKAKPAAPEAMPPTKPPTQRTTKVDADSDAKISDHIEQEREADGETRGEADREGNASAFAHRQELDGKNAQAERHVQRQRHDDAALGEFHERRVGDLQELVEE